MKIKSNKYGITAMYCYPPDNDSCEEKSIEEVVDTKILDMVEIKYQEELNKSVVLTKEESEDLRILMSQ